jgi:hypothetical protein
MRLLWLASVLALAQPAAAQQAPAADPPQVKIEPPPKQDTAPKTARTDVVTALRDLRAHVAAWLADPVRVSRGMFNTPETITIIKVQLK